MNEPSLKGRSMDLHFSIEGAWKDFLYVLPFFN
jgi:hypothetical protein